MAPGLITPGGGGAAVSDVDVDNAVHDRRVTY
jgi:hypothetical protein